MNINQLCGDKAHAPAPLQGRGYDDLAAAQAGMIEAIARMEWLIAPVGKAKAVREMHSEMCRMALADAAFPFLMAGDSASAAETKARASDGYKTKMRERFKTLEAAEAMIAQFTCAQAKWESQRTNASIEKALAGLT